MRKNAPICSVEEKQIDFPQANLKKALVYLSIAEYTNTVPRVGLEPTT